MTFPKKRTALANLTNPMQQKPQSMLDDLGPRICILGPSNAGKSTLAEAIARKRGLPCLHLDQMRHMPDTAWVLRSDDVFRALHDSAIEEPRWVMDGNYSALIPQRLARATGLIVLDVPTATSLWRYVARCLGRKPRAGGISIRRDRVRWTMIHHILGPARRNRKRYAAMYASSPLPKRFLRGVPAMVAFLRENGL